MPQAVSVTHQPPPPYSDACYLLFADVHAELAMTAMNSQTMKHLAKEGTQLLHRPKKDRGKGQPAKPHWQLQQDPFLPVLEKVLLYSHFLLSLVFFVIISVKWNS